MPSTLTAASNPIARQTADVIRRGFDAYLEDFLTVTRRAQGRFETCDWHGMQADARERLELYPEALGRILAEVYAKMGVAAADPRVWAVARTRYSEALAGHPAGEIAETFFNSIARRVLHTVGVNPAVEFLDFRFERVPAAQERRDFTAYPITEDATLAVCAVLEARGFSVPFEDLVGDAELVAAAVEAQWTSGGAPLPAQELQVLRPVFFRRKGAYVIGRVMGGNRVMPLILAIVHGPRGLRVDATLLSEDEASIVFSFTRSYFHAEVTEPASIIRFLRTLMPAKPVPELYTALGHHRHGKTEFYRDLRRHLLRTDDRFDIAPGSPGMVMVVFTMPGYDVVFKVIRDGFAQPKQTTPDEVKRRYELVFAHDRAGRLVDAQQFEGMTFPRARFTSRLLVELTENAARTVRVDGDTVAISHLYTERRVKPLDLYLQEASPDEAVRAALDYGQAIRDLAATNVFPGDLLPKNFGVTRHGRVIFYDYDELRLLSECRFRHIPPPRTPEDELSAEPWFHVGPDDVFPEDLGRFVPFTGPSREAYRAAHDALYTVEFWTGLQERYAAGEVLDIFPYPDDVRLGGQAARRLGG